MDRGLRERVRWGNVALVAGVGAVLAVVVLWPVLAPEAPRVPGRVVVPVVTATATPAPSRVRVVRPRRVERLLRGRAGCAARPRPGGGLVRVLWCGAYGGRVREVGVRCRFGRLPSRPWRPPLRAGSGRFAGAASPARRRPIRTRPCASSGPRAAESPRGVD